MSARMQAAAPELSLSTITGILSAFLNMFGGCFGSGAPAPTAASVKEMVTKEPVIARVRINMALRSEGLRPLSQQGMRAHAAVVHVVTESPDEEMNAFITYAAANHQQ